MNTRTQFYTQKATPVNSLGPRTSSEFAAENARSIYGETDFRMQRLSQQKKIANYQKIHSGPQSQ